MDLSVVISIFALIVSTLSTVTYRGFVQRQLGQFEKTNHFPVVGSLFAEFRNAKFHERYDYVVNQLKEQHDSSCGLLGLPQPAKDYVYDIAYFYQIFASLKGFGILDETENLGNLYRRMDEVWAAIKPYVLVERERSGDGANKDTLKVLQDNVENRHPPS